MELPLFKWKLHTSLKWAHFPASYLSFTGSVKRFSIFFHQVTWTLQQTLLGCNRPMCQEVRFPNWRSCTRHPLHPCWSWHPEMAKLAYLGFLAGQNWLIFHENFWEWHQTWQDVLGVEVVAQKEIACKKWKGWVGEGIVWKFSLRFFLVELGKFTSPATTTQGNSKSFTGNFQFKTFLFFPAREEIQSHQDSVGVCMVRKWGVWEESHEDEPHTKFFS